MKKNISFSILGLFLIILSVPLTWYVHYLFLVLLAFGIILFLTFGIIALVGNFASHDMKALERSKLLRNQQFRLFKSSGYYSTSKYYIGAYLFSIDRNSNQWFAMDLRNPLTSYLHKFEEIQAIQITINNCVALSTNTKDSISQCVLENRTDEPIKKIVIPKLPANQMALVGFNVKLLPMYASVEHIECESNLENIEKICSLFSDIIISTQPIVFNKVHEIEKVMECKEQPNQTIYTSATLAVTTEKQESKIIIPPQINGIPLAYHYENVEIAIISNQIPDFENISIGSVVQLIQEKTNQFDENAVSVNAGEMHLGYLYKGTLHDMANDYINHQLPISSYITRINKTDKKIEIFLGFYKIKLSDYDKLKNNGTPFETVKLTGSANEDMQETIMFSAIGEEVIFEYDCEKEKYVATSGGEIGYLPKSKVEFMESGENYQAFIESIEDNDNGKYVVSIAIFK